jgi:5'(3')-deoxyribonucleotidase
MKFHSFRDIENKVPKRGSFKHYLRLQEHGGRVVKGVNTTADVGVDAIKKQAAKFGNKVDKDGRPPTLSKKVKGSKTNVLFNLGLAESVDNTDESMLYYAKMAENLGELASTSKVFVDMDGVLADFFGEWTKLIGKDWRNVKDIEPELQKIRDTDDFFLNLPLLPQAKNLLGVIKKVKGSYTILSSPLPNDPNSEPHKREWIKKNLDFFPPENVIITHDKAKFATNQDGTPNILIDDFGKNIASWEAAGGEGFKHKDHKFERTAKAIKKHMSEPVEEKAVSKKQQQFFGIVRAMQKGDMPKGGEAGDVAKDMKKSDVKKFASTKHKGLPKKKKSEGFTRNQLPQIRKKHLEYIPHKIISIKVESIVPVQKERLKENYTKQLKKIAGGEYTPIVVDNTNRIINGHHRYDVVKLLQMESISVAKLPYTLEFVLGMMKENFADGKKKGKSRPGRVKKSGASCNGSVTSLRSKAKKASGERAKMYHWCANMKSGKKKSESLYTEKEFLQILNESTPQQLQEGIADSLKKLPKNLLGKVKPMLKKIPKTGKNLVLVATLLGTIAGAVQAGDMAKIDTPLDKLNSMTTMSATMDTGNDIGPGQMAPKNIDIIKMPTPPPAPGADTPDGTNDNGTSTQTDKNSNRTVSSGAGTYTFSPDGKLLKYETPKIKGLQQTHDIAKKTVTVDFTGQNSGASIDQKATYDMSGKLISGDRTSVSSGDMGVSIDKDKGYTIDYQMSPDTKISANSKTGVSVNK